MLLVVWMDATWNMQLARSTDVSTLITKDYSSLNLMAIVTYNMSFLDIFVGWPGRSNDAR